MRPFGHADALETRILAACDRRDTAALPALYAAAADRALDAGKEDEGCFFLTQAYIFALEAGSDLAPRIKARLVRRGRDTET